MKTPVAKKKGLGRGLEVLLGGSADITEAIQKEALPTVLALSKLVPGKYQPRTRMDEGALQDLAASIRAQGLMQPILVRPIGAESFEIIAGERRFRAAGIAGLTEVPVLVKDVPDQAAAAMALIEISSVKTLIPWKRRKGSSGCWTNSTSPMNRLQRRSAVHAAPSPICCVC